MTNSIREKMTIRCFDWLLNYELNEVTRIYDMVSLLYLGKDVKWIHPELCMVIEQNYDNESYGYQARVKRY